MFARTQTPDPKAQLIRDALIEFFADSAARGRGDDGIFGRREAALAALPRTPLSRRSVPLSLPPTRKSRPMADQINLAELRDEWEQRVRMASPYSPADQHVSVHHETLLALVEAAEAAHDFWIGLKFLRAFDEKAPLPRHLAELFARFDFAEPKGS